MTPERFIALWQNNPLTERAGAQGHFDDLCDLLGVDKPRDLDHYCFERGAGKASGGDGWADVWKRGHFGWENKCPGRDLRAALKQLTDYALELENPPLLVVSDREIIEIHTAFTGYPDQPRHIAIADIGAPENLQTLRWVFTDPEQLRPVKSLAAITEEAAGQFGALAETLRQRGLEAQPVAHFLIQCLFCMFAEDEGLLPRGLFTGLLNRAADDPARAANRLSALFAAMRDGGDYGDETIAWFNGGLFARVDVPPLERADIAALQRAAGMDWRNIDPSIFGTLFERGLNPSKRSQLGAHYTDPATIMRLVEPVIVRPLTAEWQAAKEKIAALLAKSKKHGDKAHKDATAIFQHHLERLRNYRVLDPACGSGNFLYLALKALKDLERRANTEAEALGLQRQVGIEVSPANVLGIELDPYAAELARVTVWIGELQWMLRNGYPYATQPVLRPLDTIENRDALLKVGADGTASEAEWPACDAIVGNPPFLGDKVMRGQLGADYTEALRKCYEGRVPGGADFVTYWFEKARAQVESGKCMAAGLVGTNSVRGGANRKVLDRIVGSGSIFEAWPGPASRPS
ncbi:MAG: class I SAM-dependent DNA methyltransferase [Rhodocyclales bacterium]|nr:class I SAM-dependent DNA methyltransferase [Rhodocyclales bacterium]